MAVIAKQRYKLDIAPKGGWVIVYASQHDNGARGIEFEITNQGKVFDIPANINVSVQGVKSNGGYFTHNCTYSGNVVTMALADDMTDVTGKAICVLKFTNSSQQKLATAKFILNVDFDSSSEGIIIDTVAEEIFDQLLNEIRAQAAVFNVNIATLQSMVGTPLIATTAASMTNHNKIYVYTGNETGYTYGDWYYWDDTEWRSGGQYNSVPIVVDQTPISGSTNPVSSNGVYTELGNKVDKVSGKGLSTEDYTTEEKTKLIGLIQVEVDDTLTNSGQAADAAETGKIRDAVFDYVELDKSDYLYNLQKKTSDGSTDDQSDGVRIRIIYKVDYPTDVSIECDYGDGVSVSIYDNLPNAIVGSRYYSETIGYDYAHFVSGRFTTGGYISVSQKKSDGSIFTEEERAAAFEALNVSIKYIDGTAVEKVDKKVEEITQGIAGTKELYIGELINGHLTASGTVDDNYTNYRVSTKEVVAFPCASKRRLKVNINPKYLFAIRTGAKGDNLSENYNWYENGDVVDLADDDNYYGISICHSSGNIQHTAARVYPSDDFQLSIEYIDPTPSTIEGNPEAIKKLSSARLFFSSSERNTLEKYAVIAHTSDCHGDYKRVANFLDFCDYSGVDVACITGDIVAYGPKQGIKWFNDLLNAHDVLPAVCTGNHDVYGNTMTDDDIYDFMFADIAEKIRNTTEKTWYYTDIDSKKLRIVSVNLYQYGGTNRWYTHFTEEQLEWFVGTLSNTPVEYGVIILTHAPQVTISKSSDYPTFYQDTRLYNGLHNSVLGGVPVYDIVDAFISRGTLSKTYTQTGSPDSISVSADFSNVDTSVEFIAHLTGHFHQDTIAYIPGTTNKQLMLNVTCTIATFGGSVYPYLADIQDIGRNVLDVTQDAFNVYVIDRDNKSVKIIRVGSDMTVNMQERKYMVIPYAD